MAEVFRKTGSPFTGGDVIWLRQNPASDIVEADFFGSTPAISTVGFMSYWNGTAWDLKPVKYWNGTVWIQKPVRYWNGQFWLLTEYGLGANFHPSSLDIFAWSGTAANAATLSRDTVTGKSPSNGDPLKMSVTGLDPHMGSYNGATWNIAPAANGQTWIVKVWVKASVATVGQIFIFGVDSGGNFISNIGAAFNAGGITIGTAWTEVSYSFTFSDAGVAYIQTRLDGPDTGGVGVDVWWDDLRVYRVI